MSAQGSPRSPAARRRSIFIGAAAVGWLLVYNAMRLAGSAPADAALPSLAIGAVAGVALVAGALAAVPSLRAERPGAAARIPKPDALDAAQRASLRVAGAAFGALALVTLATAGALAVDWLGASADDRAGTALILCGWNLLAGAWLGDEALRLRRGAADGLESAVLGAVLTAVLAGVGIARELLVPGQVLLIVLAGVAGGVGGVVGWRLTGGRGMPVIAALAVVVAALALAVPLA